MNYRRVALHLQLMSSFQELGIVQSSCMYVCSDLRLRTPFPRRIYRDHRVGGTRHFTMVTITSVTTHSSIELLKSPDIWIGGMGAANHTTLSKESGENGRESSISTHGVTGDVVRPDKELYIKCIHCDQYGNTRQKCLTLATVSYMKNCKYNLCSSTKMLKSGWKMIGDKKATTVEKGSMVIKFDIVIPTKYEVLFCTCLKHT